MCSAWRDRVRRPLPANACSERALAGRGPLTRSRQALHTHAWPWGHVGGCQMLGSRADGCRVACQVSCQVACQVSDVVTTQADVSMICPQRERDMGCVPVHRGSRTVRGPHKRSGGTPSSQLPTPKLHQPVGVGSTSQQLTQTGEDQATPGVQDLGEKRSNAVLTWPGPSRSPLPAWLRASA